MLKNSPELLWSFIINYHDTWVLFTDGYVVGVNGGGGGFPIENNQETGTETINKHVWAH